HGRHRVMVRIRYTGLAVAIQASNTRTLNIRRKFTMVGQVAINPSKVDWSGDNPGIYFRETPESPWSTLAVFFRVILSPKGRGHAVVVLGSPGEAKGMPRANNFCITDNEPL